MGLDLRFWVPVMGLGLVSVMLATTRANAFAMPAETGTGLAPYQGSTNRAPQLRQLAAHLADIQAAAEGDKDDAEATATPKPPTATAVPPTATTAPPTATTAPPTATPAPPTATAALGGDPGPTATAAPATATAAPGGDPGPTATAAPATATAAPGGDPGSTATAAPATATAAPGGDPGPTATAASGGDVAPTLPSPTVAATAPVTGTPTAAPTSVAITSPDEELPICPTPTSSDVDARVLQLLPIAAAGATNLRQDCRLQVTLAIWRIINWDSLGLPDVISFRKMVEDGQGAEAQAIITNVVNNANQEFAGFKKSLLGPHEAKILLLAYPKTCEGYQIDIYIGENLVGPIEEAIGEAPIEEIADAGIGFVPSPNLCQPTPTATGTPPPPTPTATTRGGGGGGGGGSFSTATPTPTVTVTPVVTIAPPPPPVTMTPTPTVGIILPPPGPTATATLVPVVIVEPPAPPASPVPPAPAPPVTGGGSGEVRFVQPAPPEAVAVVAEAPTRLPNAGDALPVPYASLAGVAAMLSGLWVRRRR